MIQQLLPPPLDTLPPIDTPSHLTYMYAPKQYFAKKNSSHPIINIDNFLPVLGAKI